MSSSNNNSQQYSMASLYVGDLHPDVSEAMIYEKFSQIGPVVSIRLCRDMITRKSLGYAYVNFQNPTDAERALDSLNFDVMKGRAIRIMWSQRDPSVRKSGVGNIFIKNLDKSIEQKELHDTFSAFGNILSCKIATDDCGKNRGYGFVHFETEESAQSAIERINGMMINNKKVFVGKFVPRVERFGFGEVTKFNNCYIKNFGDDLDDTKLRDLFNEFGEISSVKVMADDKGKSKGFGFVCFKDTISAENAVKALHSRDLNGRTLFVGRAQKKSERQEELRQRFEKQRMERTNRYSSGVNLYVKNLDDSIDDDRLKKEFMSFGNITSAKVMTDSSGRSKGFGFVCFSSPDEATKAVTEMNGKIVGTKPLYVALAQRKEDRKAHLATQYIQRVQQQLNNGHIPLLPGGTSPASYLVQSITPGQQRFYTPALVRPQPQPRFNGPIAPPPPGPAIAAQRHTIAPQYTTAAALNAAQGGIPASLAGQFRTLGTLRPMTQATVSSAAGNQGMMSSAAQAMMGPRTGPMQARPIMGQQVGVGNPSSAAVTTSVRQNMGTSVPGAAMACPPGAQTNRSNQAATMYPGPTPSSAAALAAMSSGNIRFNMSARNVLPTNAGPAPAPPGPDPRRLVAPSQILAGASSGVQQVSVGNQEPLTTTMLAQAPPQEQKQMLGERLYPLVHELYPEAAGKITGMILEIDNSELLTLLESKESLRNKVDEAYGVLQSHNANNRQPTDNVQGCLGSAGPAGFGPPVTVNSGIPTAMPATAM